MGDVLDETVRVRIWRLDLDMPFGASQAVEEVLHLLWTAVWRRVQFLAFLQRLAQGSEEFAAEEIAQDTGRQKEVMFGFAPNARPINAAYRDQEVDVRMGVECFTPGLEHGNGARHGPEPLLVL